MVGLYWVVLWVEFKTVYIAMLFVLAVLSKAAMAFKQCIQMLAFSFCTVTPFSSLFLHFSGSWRPLFTSSFLYYTFMILTRGLCLFINRRFGWKTCRLKRRLNNCSNFSFSSISKRVNRCSKYINKCSRRVSRCSSGLIFNYKINPLWLPYIL